MVAVGHYYFSNGNDLQFCPCYPPTSKRFAGRLRRFFVKNVSRFPWGADRLRRFGKGKRRFDHIKYLFLHELCGIKITEMNIVLTGSLGNISKPLAKELVQKHHSVTVISSRAERKKEIEALGAKAAIGSVNDLDFLVRTFHGADIVYLMEPAARDRMFDKTYGPYQAIRELVGTYKLAVERSGVKKLVHLSSIGAHTDEGVGILKFHFMAEAILKTLPADVSIKFMRPVGFYYNLLAKSKTNQSPLEFRASFN